MRGLLRSVTSGCDENSAFRSRHHPFRATQSKVLAVRPSGIRAPLSYPRQYEGDDTIASHLRFALRYEPIDLGVLIAVPGRLAAAKRTQFSELTDAEIVQIETQAQQAIAAETEGHSR